MRFFVAGAEVQNGATIPTDTGIGHANVWACGPFNAFPNCVNGNLRGLLIVAAPTPAPTPAPTWAPDITFSQQSNCTFQQQGGTFVCILPPVLFNLGQHTAAISTWFLAISVASTNWGGGIPYENYFVQITARGVISTQGLFPKRCAPDPVAKCPGDPRACLTNKRVLIDHGADVVSFNAAVFGDFIDTGCKIGKYNIVLYYTLTGTNPRPTAAPSLAPTQAAPSLAPTQAAAAPLIGENAPLYAVGGLAIMFVAVGVLVLQAREQGVGGRESIFESDPTRISTSASSSQMKASIARALGQSLEKKGGRIVKLNLLEVLVDFGLIGSAFISEIFFLLLLLGSDRFRYLSWLIFVGRVIHMSAASLLVYLFSSPSAGQRSPCQSARTPLQKLCNTRNLTENIKLWGLICVFGAADVTLFRYLPWLHSQFSVETKGFPSAFVFIACVSCKLLHTLMTISCQIVYLSATSSDLVFLIVNVTVTVLTFLVNAVSALLWWGFLSDWQTADGSASSSSSSLSAALFGTSNPIHEHDQEQDQGQKQGQEQEQGDEIPAPCSTPALSVPARSIIQYESHDRL